MKSTSRGAQPQPKPQATARTLAVRRTTLAVRRTRTGVSLVEMMVAMSVLFIAFSILVEIVITLLGKISERNQWAGTQEQLQLLVRQLRIEAGTTPREGVSYSDGWALGFTRVDKNGKNGPSYQRAYHLYAYRNGQILGGSVDSPETLSGVSPLQLDAAHLDALWPQVASPRAWIGGLDSAHWSWSSDRRLGILTIKTKAHTETFAVQVWGGSFAR